MANCDMADYDMADYDMADYDLTSHDMAVTIWPPYVAESDDQIPPHRVPPHQQERTRPTAPPRCILYVAANRTVPVLQVRLSS